MNKKIRIIILAVVFLFAFCFVRDFLIKSLIGTAASSITGAPTSVGGLSLSIIRQSVRISNFRMYNPKGFPKDILVDIPSIKVACNLGALMKGKIHLRQLELDIKEIGMAKNKDGRLNVDSLKIAEEKPAEKEKGKPAKQMAIQIDTVSLGMGRVVSKDYSVQGQPMVKVYDINLKKSYKDINSAQQLAALIVSEPLKAAGIQGLKVYGAAMLTGVAALPVVAAFTFAAKDYVQESFDVTMDKAYEAGLKAIKTAGKVKKEDKAAGVISAEVGGAKVTFKLKKVSDKSTQVTISARKFGFPKADIASGIMYRLRAQLE
ncbi:MAG: AsmA family protein [Candidatus Omnitrophica bacterium]|nr:AsmA family protein [Candidatus Omnitrophota bacterium]